MTEDERHAGALVAACAKEAGAHILAYAREAGLDPPSFLVSVAAVLASSALAAASRHIQNALGLVHCLREGEDATSLSPESFAAPDALQ